MWLCISRRVRWKERSRAYSSSYTWYYFFRQKIATWLELWKLEDYQWFGWSKKRPSKKTMPLIHFIYHSDCDWYIRVRKDTRLKLYEHLTNFIKSIDGEDIDSRFYIQEATTLARACYENYEEWWYLDFS